VWSVEGRTNGFDHLRLHICTYFVRSIYNSSRTRQALEQKATRTCNVYTVRSTNVKVSTS
jgi:hypothetical protein